MGMTVAHNFDQYNDKSEQEKHNQMVRSHNTDPMMQNATGDGNNNDMLK